MKKAKRSRRRRRRSFNAVTTFVCFALVLAALVSAAVIFFKIGEIRVVGDNRYADDDVIEASGIEMGQSMFLFNKFAAQNRIFAACPYIDEIQMKRTLPDRIDIIVTPCQPVAVIHSDGGYFTLDRDGKADKQVAAADTTELDADEFVYYAPGSYVIDIKGKILEVGSGSGGEKLISVSGGTLIDPQVGKSAKFFDKESIDALFSVLITAKNNDILKDISDIDVTKVYDITFGYMERFTVRIGSYDDIERKFKFVDAVVGALSPNEKGTIDVSDGKTGYFSQIKQ
ncbi:MAG: FtsQ-type POTRA domain-containing protein [Clostridia bacterium]|nr:FtsQ-type POTRA domain-containing protein [Clostridia bacterium]MBQ9966793.1 FtsQ-type POTRA domain-containing protein [Clostridia bacterium]